VTSWTREALTHETAIRQGLSSRRSVRVDAPIRRLLKRAICPIRPARRPLLGDRSRDEDELSTRPVRRVAHVLDGEPYGCE